MKTLLLLLIALTSPALAEVRINPDTGRLDYIGSDGSSVYPATSTPNLPVGLTVSKSAHEIATFDSTAYTIGSPYGGYIAISNSGNVPDKGLFGVLTGGQVFIESPVGEIHLRTAGGIIPAFLGVGEVNATALTMPGLTYDGTALSASSGTITNFTAQSGTFSAINSTRGVWVSSANSPCPFFAVENGTTPEDTVLGAGKARAMCIQGAGSAYFLGRDVTNNIEFIMGSANSGAAFAGTMSNNEFQLRANNTVYATLKTSGRFGVGTSTPARVMDINSSTGETLRLTYNDNNGGAANFVDLHVTSGGDLQLIPSGGDITSTTTVTFTSGTVVSFTATASTLTRVAVSSYVSVPTEAYGAGWNGKTEVPTKDAVYDKIETLSGGSIPAGTLFMWAGSTASIPTGYLLCDGTAVSRATYSGLFTAIGVTWGPGDGSTTFNLPDTRQRYPRGATTTAWTYPVGTMSSADAEGHALDGLITKNYISADTNYDSTFTSVIQDFSFTSNLEVHGIVPTFVPAYIIKT